MPNTQTIFLVAGGTGGHVFPALALATELMERGFDVQCITDKRGEKFFRQTSLVPHVVQSSAWAGDWKGKLKAGWKILQGLVHSFEICREFSPICVVGFGGYPSFPTIKAAQLLKIPTVLHEQNAVFGRANRQVAQAATKIATSFAKTKLLPDMYKTKTVYTGNPVRAVFLNEIKNYRPINDEKRTNILIFAGSQGSALFSRVLPEAVGKLSETLRSRLSVVQQTRIEDVDAVSQTYAAMGVKAMVQPFFTDILKLYQKAQLVISRAGASTVAEVTALGRPGIFIPLAVSLDGDQAENAAQLVAHNAGWVLPEKNFTADEMAAKLTEILSDPAILSNAAAAAKSLGKPEAASNLADVVLSAL